MKQIQTMVIAWATIIITILGLSQATLHAQTETRYERGATQAEDILPPSPEAATAVKYADVPFTHSVGAAEYDIPLYELKGHQLSIPISLSYQSNGIKVDEIAGVAGLGWTLQAGGVVTREVVYMPDEFDSWSFYELPDDEMMEYLDDNVWYGGAELFLTRTLWHQRDRSSDRYSYNVGGLSGSFIITPDREVVQLSGDGVTIVPYQATTTGPILYFTITGPDGTRYVLSEREMSMRKNQRQEFPTIETGQEVDWTAATAWYLTGITSADGTESATFTYADGGVWERDVETETQHIILQGAAGGGLDPYEDVLYPRTFGHVESSCTTRVLAGIALKNKLNATVLSASSFTYAAENTQTEHKGGSRANLNNYPRRLTGMSVYAPSGAELVHYAVDTYREPKDGRILLRKVEEYHQEELTDRWTMTYKTLDNKIYRWSQDWFGYYNDENVDEAETLSGVYYGQQNPDGSYTTIGGSVVLGPDPDDPNYYTDPRPRHNLSPYKINKGNHSISLAFGQPVASHADYLMLQKVDHDGAVTEYEYEGAMTGRPGLGNAPVSIGVRVKRISVKDGTALRHCRSFTYASPTISGWWYPEECNYVTLNARRDTTGGLFTNTKILWTFSVHEGHAGPGNGLGQSRVYYGQVTETVHPSLSDTSGVRTVYTYDTYWALQGESSTADRFPSYVDSIYNLQSNAVIGAAATKRLSYVGDGPTYPALLTRKDAYRRTAAGTEELYATERYTYGNLGTTTAVLVDYPAVELLNDGLFAGHILNQCVYHYPVTVGRLLGRVPTRVVKTGYHASGQDSTVVEYTYVARPSLETPVRVDTVSIAGSDGTRRVRYTYADTWPAATRPAWATALFNRHGLQEPLVQDYESIVGSGVATSLRRERTYNTFTLGSGPFTALMPEKDRELTDGVESWSEQVLSRDSYGNLATLKERGRPQLTITWGYDGMYPTSVTEGTGNTTLTTTYSWSPGVGITSVTDPKGTTTSYSYDAAGRLTEVRDYDNRMKESYVYALLNTGTNRRSIRHQVYRDGYGLLSAEDVTWWNTLGMKLEDIAEGAGGGGEDLVTAYEGDYLLRDDVKAWLPYPVTGTNGSFQTAAPTSSATYHTNSLAYQYKGYEQSRRDRVECTRLPGYGSAHENTLTDNVRAGLTHYLWADGYGVANIGAYPSNEVLEESFTDADGRVQVTLKDRFGTVLATERKSADGTGTTARTKYIYDVKGRLRAVAGDGIALTDTLNMWRYSYDGLGRVKSKGVPCSEREYYTYDGEDRIIAVRRGSTYTETEYDALGRVRKVWVRLMGGPRTLVEEHRYDSRDADAVSVLGYGGYLWPAGTPTAGLETYVQKAITDGNGGFTGQYVETAYLYDEEGRPIYVVTRYPEAMQGMTAERLLFDYDLTGNVIRQVEEVKTGLDGTNWNANQSGLPTVRLTTVTSYDLRSRPVQLISKLEGASVATQTDTTSITYDALGRPTQTLSTSNGAQPIITEDSYTLQGWLNSHHTNVGTHLLFSEALFYETASGTDGYGVSWTGLVTAQNELWADPSEPPVVAPVRKRYRYDAFGRLDRSKLLVGPVNPITKEERYTYDGRGNLLRTEYVNGNDILPNDQYSYSGNRLVSRSRVYYDPQPVVLSTVPFTHDALGRMTHDGTSNLDITYNYLDMPEKISRNDTLLVKYLYLSDGMKTGARNSSGQGLEYRGTMTFRREAQGTLTFESVPFAAGRMTADGIRYHVKDHLGSVRAVLDGATGSLLEAGDYSAYGSHRELQLPLVLANQLASASFTAPFRHHFTGQEEQTGLAAPGTGTATLSLPYTDFGARHYSPSLSRWLVPDPLSEKYYDVSPYAYCANDPVNLVDPDGMDIFIWYGQENDQKCFRFTGKETDIPDDDYVRDVIAAYQYNKANWERAGFSNECPSSLIVEDSGIRLNVMKNSSISSRYYRDNGGIQKMIWNPYEGTLTDNGVVLSAATIFSHEADHAFSDYKDALAHSSRQNQLRNDDYENEEEYRVITGTEQLMARANGEISKNQVTRKNHFGSPVITLGVTSTIVDKKATEYYYANVKGRM
ncbi:MAG: RHS repeat-associated core domain-containing protein [Bacteroidales bacterium]|nr:RHS repeat-associated core domain-containing protein [Bacteroidales bacterium]